MRIGSTVLLTEKGCVQSYGWTQFRQLGRFQHVLDALDEYQCDEIAVIRPVRDKDLTVDFCKGIELVKKMKTMTPTSFGGGIRTIEHLQLLNGLPIERLIFSSAFLNGDEHLLMAAKSLFGRQAIQCMLPFSVKGDVCSVYISSRDVSIDVDALDWVFINEHANEVIIYDTVNEGSVDGFDFNLLEKVAVPLQQIVISGGIGGNVIKKAKALGIASVLIDNKALHKEYSIRKYKDV